MLSVSVEGAKVTEAVSKLIANIEMLAPKHGESSTILRGFVEWQEEDMKRKFPNLVIEDDMTAMTMIWPRSRQSQPFPKPGVRRPLGRPKASQPRIAAPTIVRRGRLVHRARPILRPELFKQLQDRMRDVLNGVPPWR